MTTEAEAGAKLQRDADARAQQAHIVKTGEGREFLLVPNQFQHHDVTERNAIAVHSERLPDHVRQSVAVQTSESLAEYIGRYKTEDTVLFADISNDVVVAVIDYHSSVLNYYETAEKGGEELKKTRTDAAPHRLAHRATLTLRHSVEWKEWTGISDKLMPQIDFARFLEENGDDVKDPSGADLLECVRDLQAHRNMSVKKGVRTASGTERFEFFEETTAKSAGADIPTRFELGIPVYFGEQDEKVHAFLRWKLEDKAVTLGIKLHRPEHLRQAVFESIVRNIAGVTDCPVIFGKI